MFQIVEKKWYPDTLQCKLDDGAKVLDVALKITSCRLAVLVHTLEHGDSDRRLFVLDWSNGLPYIVSHSIPLLETDKLHKSVEGQRLHNGLYHLFHRQLPPPRKCPSSSRWRYARVVGYKYFGTQ